MNDIRKVIIIGSGPAAHSAAIYAGRANLSPIMFEGLMAGGIAAGGQLTTTTEVENYAGFPDGISGPQLMERMRIQSEKCGTTIYTETVAKLIKKENHFIISSSSREISSYCVIIATGATAKRMEVPGAEDLWQKGISACAVCDGALPVFRDKQLAVVGGGDTACEEASHLTKFGSKIYMLVRKNKLVASKAMQKRVKNNSKIEIFWETTLDSVEGNNFLQKINIVKNGTISQLEVSGLFYAIGHIPNTQFLQGQLELNSSGYIVTKAGRTHTSTEGIFAAGDVQDQIYRQAITSAGTGCMAALDSENYLAKKGYL